MPPEDHLAVRAAADLDGTFPDLLAAHGAAVFTTALRVSRQPADAEDLASETFVRAYRAMQGYSPARIRGLRLRPWLVTITLNLWRNQLRKAGRSPRTVPLGTGDDPAAGDGGPEQAAHDRRGAGWVEACLDTLPDPQRQAVVLRHVVGLPYAEVAEAMACPVGTAKSHASRGLASLRRRLATTDPLEGTP
jgi:RNA polymerase sigma-70 factor (ECF subfamily)